MSQVKLTLFGAGHVGTALATVLAGHGRFAVQVVDGSDDALDRLQGLGLPLTLRHLAPGEEAHRLIEGQDIVVAAVPDQAVARVAEAALLVKAHYLDFIPTPRAARASLDALAGHRAVLTGCGVSPGLIGVLACGLLKDFAPVSDLVIRVGAIPRHPTNRLGYGQIWNVDGLIEEYTRPSAAIRDGAPVELTPLEEYERLTFDGIGYEAFVTAGGLADLDALAGFTPRNVTVKTLRYPGHLDYMRFLLDDLGLRHRRDLLRTLLSNGLPLIEDDVLHVVLTARGERGRQQAERTLRYRFAPNAAYGPFNALTSVATGSAASLLTLLADGALPDRGRIAPHHLDAARLLDSPFIAPLRQD